MSGEDVILRKNSKQAVLLKDKRRLREKRRSTGIGELGIDNLMLNDELTASNTALNESPLPLTRQTADRRSMETKSSFFYPSISSETSTELSAMWSSSENTFIYEPDSNSEKLDGPCQDDSKLYHSSSSPPNLLTIENNIMGIKCQNCSIILESHITLQNDYLQLKKNYEQERENMEQLLEENDNQIKVLAGKVALLSDTLKLADESYNRLKEENDILMKHFGSD